jgi:hypothetical protein
MAIYDAVGWSPIRRGDGLQVFLDIEGDLWRCAHGGKVARNR